MTESEPGSLTSEKPPVDGAERLGNIIGQGLVVVGIPALVIYIAIKIFGGGDPAAEAVTSAAPSAPAATAAVTTAPAKTTQSATSDQPPGPLKFLKKNYSDAAWYSHITGAHRIGSVTWIETDYGPGATRIGAKICSAVSAWQFKQFHEFRGVTVRSSDGHRLSRRIYLKDPC